MRVATYNVLATAYIRPDYYPGVPLWRLESAWRLPAVVRRVLSVDADVLCLQEVERPVWEALEHALAARGFTGKFWPKARGRPDGCATWVRGPVTWHGVAYADGVPGRPDSGHVALIAEMAGMAVANTHLRWDPPATPEPDRVGLRQARELLEGLQAPAIVCGDLNVTPGDPVTQLFEAAGYRDVGGGPTCVANGRARKLDYIFLSAGLRGTPEALMPLQDTTPLPSESEPSDHLPLMAEIESLPYPW